ncbi:MAG: TrkA family potassium uptake protein [Candidatus Kapabacteria bacterium]|jgi:trk system potassium uptake protein TrkA|nr:TrkA family potassium uptake protein [Candidatus Kapabacteria bacterium]
MATKKFCVIGLGYFGSNLARSLTKNGAEVLAIDKNIKRVEEVQDEVAVAVVLDSTDKDALSSQGVQDFDAVIVAIGEGFESSITTTSILQELGVKNIYNRMVSKLHARLLKLLGIENILLPEAEAADHLARRLVMPGLIDTFPLSNSHSIFIVNVPKKFIGKTLRDSNLRIEYNLNVVTIKKLDSLQKQTPENLFAAETIGVPDPSYRFEENDLLVLFGNDKDLRNFLYE